MSTESSESPPVSTDSVFQMETAANDNENNSGNMHPGANYFFGFLITFIVLLFIFIGCGVGSRRRMARRRALFLGEAGSWNGLRPDMDQKEPVLWEPNLVKGGDMWSSIMPLSLAVLQQQGKGTTASSAPTPVSRGLSAFPFFSWIPTPHPASNTKLNGGIEAYGVSPPPAELQVAVMITLPSNKDLTNKDSLVGPSEYQFGIICIPWEPDQHKTPSNS